MNKLDNKAIDTMRSRTKTGVIIGGYLVILIALLYFSNNTGGTSWMHFEGANFLRFALALTFVLSFAGLSFFIAKELDFCFLGTNRRLVYWVTALLLFLGQLVPTIVFLLPFYGIVTIEREKLMLIYLCVSLFFGLSGLIGGFILSIKYRNTKSISMAIFPLILMGLIGSFEYIYYLSIVRGGSTGLIVMTGVFACDIFAYFGGMLFGKHKLAPIVSPKKSWEGAIIGGVFATGYILLMLLAFDYAPYDSSLLFFGYGFMQMNYLWWIAVTIFAIAIVILTILGDLLFSWFKRANRIKDFGTILPGHGGILDRLDAVLVVSLIVGSAMGLTYFVASFVCHDFTLFFVV